MTAPSAVTRHRRIATPPLPGVHNLRREQMTRAAAKRAAEALNTLEIADRIHVIRNRLGMVAAACTSSLFDIDDAKSGVELTLAEADDELETIAGEIHPGS